MARSSSKSTAVPSAWLRAKSPGRRSIVDEAGSDVAAGAVDVGDFCRNVEACLARVNQGHLVRIVGAGFELVRAWALEGMPPSVVYRGIERKAERHRAGRATRPLRIEFCEADVRETYDAWRRAIGLMGRSSVAAGADVAIGDPDGHEPEARRRKASLAKHLDRAIDRLSRVSGRLDLPTPLVDAVSAVLDDVSAIRDAASGMRGSAKDNLAARLAPLDSRLVEAASAALDDDTRAGIRGEAEADLSAYRGRLDADAWRRSVEIGVARLLRERFGLPTIEPGI
jgi:hypothetical protein